MTGGPVSPVARRWLEAREIVRGKPNLRDHGRGCEQWLLDLLVRLQAKYGQAYASEGQLRTMIGEDHGHWPGVTTVRKALRRLAKQGLLVQVWLRAGQIKPNGKPCLYGTRLVWVPKCRRQRRAARRFNERQDRRAGYETRLTGHGARELVAKIAAPPPPAPRPTVDPFADVRARQLAAALARTDLWTDAPPKKPPE